MEMGCLLVVVFGPCEDDPLVVLPEELVVERVVELVLVVGQRKRSPVEELK